MKFTFWDITCIFLMETHESELPFDNDDTGKETRWFGVETRKRMTFDVTETSEVHGMRGH